MRSFSPRVVFIYVVLQALHSTFFVGSHVAGIPLNDCTLQKRDSTSFVDTATGLLSYLNSDEK